MRYETENTLVDCTREHHLVTIYVYPSTDDHPFVVEQPDGIQLSRHQCAAEARQWLEQQGYSEMSIRTMQLFRAAADHRAKVLRR